MMNGKLNYFAIPLFYVLCCYVVMCTKHIYGTLFTVYRWRNRLLDAQNKVTVCDIIERKNLSIVCLDNVFNQFNHLCSIKIKSVNFHCIVKHTIVIFFIENKNKLK